MTGCTCEPGVRIDVPHAPYDCRQNPGWDQDERLCPTCGYGTVEPSCPAHGHLADVPDEDVA